jgi:hypothetical protein
VVGALQRLAPCCQLPPSNTSEQVRATAFTAVGHLLRPAADSHDQVKSQQGGGEGQGPPQAPTLDELLGMDLESLIISPLLRPSSWQQGREVEPR